MNETSTANTVNFFQAIFSNCEQGKLEFRFLPSKKQTFWPLSKLPGLPALDLGQNCYFGCATRNGGGTKEHIVEIPCLWTDNDFKLHSREEIDKLLAECPFPPSIQEFTGGYQCFWFLKEPAGKDETPIIESLLRRLAVYFNADSAACDASRVLRVPGTFNLKPEYQKPKVEILSMDPSRRYDLSDFHQWLPDDPKKQTPTGGTRNAQGWQNEALKGVEKGSRHKTAVSLAGRYFQKGLDPAEVRAILFQWNVANTPPLDESELERILRDVESMHAKERGEPQKPTGDLFTDLENAARFADKHRGKIRFCHKFNKHFVWSGKRWEMDASGGVYRLAREYVLSLLESARSIQDDKERAFFLKEMAKLQNEKKLTSMLNLARHFDGIPVAPEDLDKDLMLFNCDDVTVDLRSFQYIPHDPLHLITKLAPFPIDAGASCPKWKEHLKLIMDGNQTLIEFLQRAFGSCLAGDNRNRKLFLLWGNGANGKSVTLETIQMVMGDFAAKTPAETLLVKRFESIPNDLARLNGARFVYTSEVSDGKKMAEALVKELTGDKFITARFMRGEWFEFPVTFKIFLATNHLPTVQGTDSAIWDRIMLIPFNVRIPEEQRRAREDLLEGFKAEASGILKWLLYGCHEWLVGGLNPPPEVLAANVTYREQSDFLKAFFDDACTISEKAYARSADLYAAYEKWAKENGEDPISKTAFGKRLKEKGFKDGKERGARCWKGIGLIQEGT
jgi:P4 family phage/plasmid primase-like protien